MLNIINSRVCRQNSSLIAVMIFFMFSCSKEMKFELPEFDPILAVESYFEEGKTFSVFINKTYNLNDTLINDYFSQINDFPFIEDAKAYLTEEGGHTAILEYAGESVYTTNLFRAKENLTYNLKVIVPGFDTVESSCFLPPKPVIEKITYLGESENATGRGKGKLYEVSIKNTDPEEIEYFSILLEKHNWAELKYPFEDVIPGDRTDPVLFSENMFTELNDSTLSLKFGMYWWETCTLEYFIVKIASLSPVYFNAKYNSASNYLSGYPPTYTNITNGVGIFAGYSVTVDTVYIDSVQ